MTIHIYTSTITQDGTKPGSIVRIVSEPFSAKEPSAMYFVVGNLGTAGIDHAFYHEPTDFEFQIPINFPSTPKEGAKFGFTLTFRDTSETYIMSKYDSVTVVNYTDDKQADMLKCIPMIVSLSDIRETRFMITGTNLSDASGLYWQKISGDGPSRVPLMISSKSNDFIQFVVNPAAIASLKADSRFRINAMSASTGELLTCPSVITLEEIYSSILKSAPE